LLELWEAYIEKGSPVGRVYPHRQGGTAGSTEVVKRLEEKIEEITKEMNQD